MEFYADDKKYVVRYSKRYNLERVEIFREMFGGKFYSTTGVVLYFDNMKEVNEFLISEGVKL